MRDEGSSRPHGSLKGPKMAKNDQNLEFLGFRTIHFSWVKNVIIVTMFLCKGSNRERKTRMKPPGGPIKGPLGAKQRGLKGQKKAKIVQNLEFFSILLPSNSLWQQIFTIFTLLLCRGVVENDRRV